MVRSAPERDRELEQPAEGEVRPVADVGGLETQARISAEDRPEDDLALETGERRTEAEVRPEAEREMAVVGARDVEAIGFREHDRISVGGPDHGDDQRTR